MGWGEELTQLLLVTGDGPLSPLCFLCSGDPEQATTSLWASISPNVTRVVDFLRACLARILPGNVWESPYPQNAHSIVTPPPVDLGIGFCFCFFLNYQHLKSEDYKRER